MANLAPIEGQPGLFRDPNDPSGEIYNIRDFREGDKYDTVFIASGTIALNTELIFFQDVQNKRKLDTNFATPAKLSAGESMVLDRIGLYMCSALGNIAPVPADFKQVIDNSYFELRINDILQDEGPSIKFPSGLGFYGNSNEDGQGIVSIGVPATASASRLIKKQILNQNHQLRGVMRFDPRNWISTGAFNVAYTAGAASQVPVIAPVLSLTGAAPTPQTGGVAVRCMLHGLLRVASSK